MDFFQYLADNIWLPILFGLSFIIFILFVIWAICKCRHYARFDYSALNREIGLAERLEDERRLQQQSFRDTALMNCQYYLRSSREYRFSNHLPQMGNRIEKHWFLVKGTENSDMLLTMMAKSPKCSLALNKFTRKSLKELFHLVQHPYLFPIYNLDFLNSGDYIIVVQPYNTKGSIKDLIYRSYPQNDWKTKYHQPGRSLKTSQIKLYGKQILEGLYYLEVIGLSTHGHLHSGNVLVVENMCRLCEYTNSFFGYTFLKEAMVTKKLRNQKNAIDVFSFGILLYEMSSGRELDTVNINKEQLSLCEDSGVVEVLEFIFKSEKIPKIQDVIRHPYFASITLPEVVISKNKSPKIHFTSVMKSLLKQVGKEKNSKFHKSKLNRSKNKNQVPVNYTVNTSSARINPERLETSSSSESSLVETNTQLPIPPQSPPKQHTVEAFSQSFSIPNSSSRTALLSSIKQGRQLKKTFTNDRSAAPKV